MFKGIHVLPGRNVTDVKFFHLADKNYGAKSYKIL
jgi:hypothetical protein